MSRVIILHSTRTPIAPESLDKQSLDALLMCGVVNPFGPTLVVVAAIGSIDRETELPLVQLSLTPFQQTAHQVGTIKLGKTWDPFEDLAPLCELPYAACPTLVAVSRLLNEEDATGIAGQILSLFPDLRTVRDSVLQHFGDPWARVRQEIESAAHAAITASHSGDLASADLSSLEIMQFADMLLSHKHFNQELQAFMHAWKGSIDWQKQSGTISKERAQVAMPIEDIQKWLTRCGATCRFPDDPKEVRTRNPQIRNAGPSSSASSGDLNADEEDQRLDGKRMAERGERERQRFRKRPPAAP